MPKPTHHSISLEQFGVLLNALNAYQVALDDKAHPNHKDRSIARQVNDKLGVDPNSAQTIEVRGA